MGEGSATMIKTHGQAVLVQYLLFYRKRGTLAKDTDSLEVVDSSTGHSQVVMVASCCV